MTSARRSFAIIPACGHSRRMGTDKLLLPWRDSTILETVIDAWQQSDVDHVLVVIPQQRDDLLPVLKPLGVQVVAVDPRPSDMKASIQHGLREIESRLSPTPNDVWLVAPADMPTLSPTTINLVLRAAEDHPGRIIVPTSGTKHGHPVLLPWNDTPLVFALPENQGINALLKLGGIVTVDADQLGHDVDTPADYHDLRKDLR